MKRAALLIWLLALPAQAEVASPRQQHLQSSLRQLVQSAHLRTGVEIRHFRSGEEVNLEGDTPFPLASVFKLPLMLELVRQIQEQGSSDGGKRVQLDTQLTLHSSDKCVGSGTLKNQPDGSQVSVQHAIELMETISDNTATDMLFRRIGLESVDRMLRTLDCTHSEIQLTNRAAWLISLAACRQFRGMHPDELVESWKNLSTRERLQLARAAESENQRLSLSAFQRLEDASNRNTHAQDVLIATTIDNLASPADLGRVLEQLDPRGKLLTPHWKHFCLGVLSRQRYNTRIPRGLPPGVKVYHKTGTIAGVVNDVGLVELPDHSLLAVVVLVQQVGAGQTGQAERLIADITHSAYAAYSR